MRNDIIVLAFLSLAAMACTLGTAAPTSTPAPTATLTALTVTALTVTATSAPTTSNGRDDTGSQDTKISTCVPPSGWVAYWVQPGDTVNTLALRTYSRTVDLIRANCLSNPNRITTGQLIYLPRNPLPPPPTNTGVPGGSGCSDALPARLAVGSRGRVTPGLPNSLLTGPDTVGTTVIGQIPGGGQFTVVGGPACGAGMRWWQVNHNGQFGWTPEGQGMAYWLEPVVTGDECAGILPTRLQVGGGGRAPFGKRGPLYVQPIPDLKDLNAIIGVIPDNGQFTVLAGPRCVNNQMRWWQVNYGGAIGWTIEATPTLYWLEPAASGTDCGFALPARLRIGGNGRVVPGDPNRLRTGPDSVGTTVIGQIPDGGQFRVIDGPTCASGMRWWRVESGSLIGWTPEGQGTAYWLEPL